MPLPLPLPLPPFLYFSLPLHKKSPKTEHSVILCFSPAPHMAAIVCHGLQSCLDSQLVESRIYSLRLPSPKPLTPQPIDLAFKSCFWESNTKPHCEENSYYKTDTKHQNPNEGSWSSIQSLSNVSQGSKEPTYVNPHVKLSPWMRLSPKSLDLCTENLGNETGTDIKESNIDFLSSKDCGGGNLESKEQTKLGKLLGAKKAKTPNFPPPLTTMRGSESLRVRPHREGGRLVIEVTKVPSSASCFQAERSHGRLRLCFWTDPEDDDGIEEELETEMNGQRQEVEDKHEEEEEEEEEDAEEEEIEEGFDNENEGGEVETRVGGCNKETKGKGCWSIGSDARMDQKKYERGISRRRCKEGGGDHENNEILLVVKNWGEPLWVTTS